MAKLDYLQAKKLNPADELRDTLRSLEEGQARLKSLDAPQALAMLQDLDRVHFFFKENAANGLDLLPEEGRWAAIEARLKKSAKRWLRAMGGASALRRQRPSPAPAEERWWWYIDVMIAAQQKRSIRQLIIGLVIVLLVVGGLILAFKTVLAPAPEVVARIEAENNAYLAIDGGDYQAALAALKTGLAQIPGDPDLLLLQGVLQEALGAEAEAAESFAIAQETLNDPLDFYVSRSQLEIRINQPEKAEADARAALAIDDNSARAWLLLGQSLEAQGNGFEAITAYEQAGELAFASGDNQIVVIARLAMARLGMGGVPGN